MSKKTALILTCLTIGLLAGATPVLAQATCTEPVSPAIPDGNTVTQPQLVAAIGGVKDFIAKSDLYQQCLADQITAAKDLAVKNKTAFDPAIQESAEEKVKLNQTAKEKAGTDINASIVAFKAKNPPAAK